MTELQNFIDEMRSTSSATDKVAIIARSSAFIHKVLEYTYNPFKQYYTTSKTCKKNSDKCYYDSNDLYPFELLDLLSDRKFTGHEAIALVNGFVENTAYGELLYRIIDKNLDIRAGDKVINKASTWFNSYFFCCVWHKNIKVNVIGMIVGMLLEN